MSCARRTSLIPTTYYFLECCHFVTAARPQLFNNQPCAYYTIPMYYSIATEGSFLTYFWASAEYMIDNHWKPDVTTPCYCVTFISVAAQITSVVDCISSESLSHLTISLNSNCFAEEERKGPSPFSYCSVDIFSWSGFLKFLNLII